MFKSRHTVSLISWSVRSLPVLTSICMMAQNWAPLGGGIPQSGGAPRVMFSDTVTGYMYVAGSFNSIDGKNTKGIARWNGSEWDSLGNGLNGLMSGPYVPPVYAMASFQGELYVGGVFSSLGNVEAYHIGKWNGVAWDSIAVQPFTSEFSGGITCLSVIENELYVGGSFDSINNVPCKSFASWNGTSWNTIGLPPCIDYSYSRVNAICKYNGEIYIGGNFGSYLPPEQDTIMDIIRWDGVNWKSVGGGMRGLLAGVNKMIVYHNELYVAGSFFKADGNVGQAIQKWNGSEWSEIGGSLWGPSGIGDAQVVDMVIHNDKLYVAGGMYVAGGIAAEGIAVWDGSVWCGFGSTFDNGVNTICFYNDTMYVGGGFWTVNGDSIDKIARWTAGNYVEACGNNTAVNEADQTVIFSVYPNPTEGLLKVESTDNLSGFEFYISNSEGKIIQHDFISSASTILNLSNYPCGIYIVRIFANNGRYYHSKFVKK